MGGAMERGALGPSLFCIFIWPTTVYDPVACWTWNPNGWIFQRGGLDFAGGVKLIEIFPYEQGPSISLPGQQHCVFLRSRLSSQQERRGRKEVPAY